MKFSIDLIKKSITIICSGIILLTFILTTLSTNKKSPNFIEYTDLSKFFLNLIIFFLLTLIFIHSINPKIVCSIFIKRFGFISTQKGKLILLSAISIMYFGTGSLPQKIFGLISFLSTVSLFLSEYFFNCKMPKKNSFVEEKTIKNVYKEGNNTVITTTSQSFGNEMNK